MCLPPVMDRQWALLVLRAVTVGPFTVRPFEGSLKGLSLGWGGGTHGHREAGRAWPLHFHQNPSQFRNQNKGDAQHNLKY